jgi:FlaA1/EpsC-like NDP-sugar epimerase
MKTKIEDLVLNILGKRYLPIWLILLIDLSMVLISYIFAELLLTNFSVPNIATIERLQPMALVTFCFGVSFVIFKSYEGAFRHTGARDLSRIFIATIVALSVVYGISRFLTTTLLYDMKNLTLAFLILQGFTFSMGVLGLRLFVKLSYGRFVLKTSGRKEIGVLIYGAGVTGITVRNAIRQDPKSNTEVVGFVDDNEKVVGKRIDGIKVYAFDEVFDEKFLNKNKVKGVVWSIQKEVGTSFHKVGDACIAHTLTFQRVPNIKDWIGGTLSSNQLRKVRIEDLLNRTPISLDHKEITSFIKGKRVLVTGAAGSIGSEICRQVLHYAPESLTIVDIAETPMNDLVLELSKIGVMFERVKTYIGDVTRENRINEIFEAVKPEVVFHAAAYKHVPMMENNAKEAVKVNVFGTKLVAQASIQYGVKKFVMISTDKAVNPANVMGATKRSAEILVQSLNTQGKTEFITTRFGNVLGSNGSVIPLFRRQIENREDLTVTHKDIVRYFMTIPEAVQLVLEAGTMGKGGEIFVFDMGKAVRIYDLAEKMVKLSGLTLNQDIRIVETGLRPGEKLYEELLSDAESTIPTHHPKIMIAKVRQYSAETIDPIFNQMTYSSMNGSTDSDMVKLLKQLVPEFISLNSEYSKLD